MKKYRTIKNLVFKSEEHTVNISYLGKTSELSALIPNNKKYCVVLDKKISKFHENFVEKLKSRNFSIFTIDSPEKQKNINTCLDVINFMQKEGFNRNDAVI